MKQKRKKLRRKLLSFLLTLAMVVGLMPGMGLTAYAAESTVKWDSIIFDANPTGGTFDGITFTFKGGLSAKYTFTAPETSTFTKIVFTACEDPSADSGQVSVENNTPGENFTKKATWTGNAKTVVITVGSDGIGSAEFTLLSSETSLYTVEVDGSISVKNLSTEEWSRLVDDNGNLTIDLSGVSGSNSVEIAASTAEYMMSALTFGDAEPGVMMWLKEDTSGITEAWYGMDIPAPLLNAGVKLRINQLDLSAEPSPQGLSQSQAGTLKGMKDALAIDISAAAPRIDFSELGDRKISFYVNQPEGWDEAKTKGYYLREDGGAEEVPVTFENKEIAAGTGRYAKMVLSHLSIYMLVQMADQDAPAKPVMVGSTADSITLEAITNGEYRCDDGEWQTSPVFTGLSADTEYTFYQRLKGDVSHNASPSSEGAGFRTAQTHDDITYAVGLDRSSVSVTMGSIQALTAAVTPDNAADKTVKWSVAGTNADAVKLYTDEACTTEVGANATDKLTVYAKGISAGSATVTATSNADSTKSASCDVTVNTPALDPVSYMAWNGTTLVEKTGDDACTDYTVVTADTTTFEDGKWYVVSNSVTVSSRITVTGTVNLILRDGATLTASKGITVNSGNTINIYAQIGGTGELNAGSDTNVASIGGGERGASSGTVNIHGGKITATGGSNASGIGGALDGGNGEVNIYSGEVTARGQNFAAGIGGYSGKSGGTVNIYGGTVNASGSQYGTTGIGIGGIKPGSCVVHIYGGEVTATSEKAAAGMQGTITIDGGTVTANGGVSDAIDCSSGETYSSNGINGTVTVNGGTVTATGGNVTVTSGYAGAIESYGGTIYACSGINGTVTISGGTVTATGGNVTGDINNYRGTIYACNGVNGTVTISGGTVTATGGSHTGQFSSSGGTTVKEKGFGGSLTIGDSVKVFGGDNADPTTEIEKSNDDYARFKYMLVKLGHVHSFTYEANDATIKATCSQNDCTLNDGQGNHTAILTIGAPTLNTYGQTGAGISAEATITDADNIKGTATVVYKKGDETLASAPTDAGTYTASITLGTATASVEYTIAQKEVTVSGITASDKIYAGNTDATLVTTAAAFTGKLDGDTLTVSATGTFDNANVGENKTVTISNLTLDGTSKDNYVLAATGQQTTTTAKIKAREIGLTWSNTELAYTGEAQKPTATATGVVEGDTCTVTVSGEQTNIGDNYTATAESLSNSNYKLPENKTTTFKIVKGNAVAAAVTANNRTYDGTEKPLVTVDESSLVGGTMRYAPGTATEATQPYTTSIPTATNAGTYYVWYKAVGDESHSDSAAASIEVTIVERSAASGDGEVKVPSEKEAGNFAAGGLDNAASEVKKNVLDTEDQKKIAAGIDVNVWLEVSDNTASASEEDKAKVVETIGRAFGGNYEVGCYLDLTLWKQAADQASATMVTEVPNGAVRVTLTIPEQFRRLGVDYGMIRIHNGIASVLNTSVDRSTWKMTFETDGFSTYALIMGGSATSEEDDFLQPLREKLHEAGEAGGAQTVEHEGGFALPIEFMTYLKNHPKITLVYKVTYGEETFTVTIPGSKAIVDEAISWYGPLWLKAHYGEGAQKTAAVKAPKTGDNLYGYNFWLFIMAAGVMVCAAGVFSQKKNGLKNQK